MGNVVTGTTARGGGDTQETSEEPPHLPLFRDAPPRPELKSPLDVLTKIFAAVIIMLLVCVFALLLVTLSAQLSTYRTGVDKAIAETPVNHANVLVYARSADFAVVKTSALFLAFVLIFVGAMYVLRSVDKEFALHVEGLQGKGSLQTSSPGLVMVTLGVTLVALVLYAKSVVTYYSPAHDGDGAYAVVDRNEGEVYDPNVPEGG